MSDDAEVPDRPTNPLEGATFVLWVDYGVDGWQPQRFDNLDDLSAYILSGKGFGPMVATRVLEIRVDLSGLLELGRMASAPKEVP